MANYARKFVDPAGTYNTYISNVVYGNSFDTSNQTRGVIQVDLHSGTVNLQMRLSNDAPWLTVKTYTTDTIEEIVLASQMRIDVTGTAECWLAETH